MKNKYDQAFLQSQLEIQEQNLRTISQQIHENIGQVLSLAKLQLHSIQDNYTKEDLQPTKDLIAKSINDLRDLSKSLNPDRIANIGLLESIRHELQLLQKNNLIKTGFDVKGAMQRLPPEKKIIVFRIFQELMNHVTGHSGTSVVNVTLQYEQDHLELTLTGNEESFSQEGGKGICLSGIKNRAGMINAFLNVERILGNGTTASLTVPFS